MDFFVRNVIRRLVNKQKKRLRGLSRMFFNAKEFL